MNDLLELLQRRVLVLPVWGWLALGAHQLLKRATAVPRPRASAAAGARMEWGPKPLEYGVRYPQRWKIAGTGAATVVRFLGELTVTREEVEELIKGLQVKIELGEVIARLAESLIAKVTETSFTAPNEATITSLKLPTGKYRYRITCPFVASETSIRGIVKPAVGERDEFIWYNAGAKQTKLLNNSLAATASERIETGIGENVIIVPGEPVRLFYDHVSERWRIQGIGIITATRVSLDSTVIPVPSEAEPEISATGALTRVRVGVIQGNGETTEYNFASVFNLQPMITFQLWEEVENTFIPRTPAEAGVTLKTSRSAPGRVELKFAVAVPKGKVWYLVFTG